MTTRELAKRRPRRLMAGSIALAVCAAGLARAQETPPDFTGVWSGFFTTDSDPYWQIEDLQCFPGCPVALRERIAAALDNPANRGRLPELRAEVEAFMAQYTASLMTPDGLARLEASAAAEADLASYCDPYGLVRQAMNPLPIRIRNDGDRVIFEYEEWSLTRTIYLDGTAPPSGESRTYLGHSVGHYNDEALVVETTRLSGDYYPFRSGSYSDSAAVLERYTVQENPRRLVLELTVTDPVTLIKPYVWTKTWLYTPEVELVQDSCEDVPGQF